jgi:vacuolar-type H+-ATPase subunit I/STV1
VLTASRKKRTREDQDHGVKAVGGATKVVAGKSLRKRDDENSAEGAVKASAAGSQYYLSLGLAQKVENLGRRLDAMQEENNSLRSELTRKTKEVKDKKKVNAELRKQLCKYTKVDGRKMTKLEQEMIAIQEENRLLRDDINNDVAVIKNLSLEIRSIDENFRKNFDVPHQTLTRIDQAMLTVQNRAEGVSRSVACLGDGVHLTRHMFAHIMEIANAMLDALGGTSEHVGTVQKLNKVLEKARNHLLLRDGPGPRS